MNGPTEISRDKPTGRAPEDTAEARATEPAAIAVDDLPAGDELLDRETAEDGTGETGDAGETGEAEPDGVAAGPDATVAERARRRRGKRKKAKATGICALTGREVPRRELFPIDALRPQISERLRADHPDLPPDALVSRREIDRLRTEYIGDILASERGALTVLEDQVIASLEHHETLAENIEDEFEQERSFGERVSDRLASFGGSWAFLGSFGAVLLVWMGFNIVRGEQAAFDPYPFILLNLVLSCIAAIQAPVIMMSQRRSEAKDRLRALNDYRVNLKAELEIRHLHEKMDHILKSQWERLTEMQEIQLDLLQELDRRSARRR